MRRKFLKRKSKKIKIKKKKLNWGRVRSRIDCWGPKSPPTNKVEEESFGYVIKESPLKEMQRKAREESDSSDEEYFEAPENAQVFQINLQENIDLFEDDFLGSQTFMKVVKDVEIKKKKKKY